MNDWNMRISVALQIGISKSILATMGARKDTDTVERRINGGQSTLSVPDMVDLGTYSNNQNVALGLKED
jgi:hypothetical protein